MHFLGAESAASAPGLLSDAPYADDGVGFHAGSLAGEQERISVEVLVGGDGSIHHERGKMRAGTVWAASQARASRALFFQIDWDIEVCDGLPSPPFSLPTFNVPGMAAAKYDEDSPVCVVPAPPQYSTRSGLVRVRWIAHHLRCFLDDHPGVAVILFRIGARGPIALSSGEYSDPPFILWRTTSVLGCVDVSLLNAVGCLLGAEAASAAAVILRSERQWWFNLKPLGYILGQGNDSLRRVQVRKEPAVNALIGHRDRMAAFIWLATVSHGVSIV